MWIIYFVWHESSCNYRYSYSAVLYTPHNNKYECRCRLVCIVVWHSSSIESFVPDWTTASGIPILRDGTLLVVLTNDYRCLWRLCHSPALMNNIWSLLWTFSASLCSIYDAPLWKKFWKQWCPTSFWRSQCNSWNWIGFSWAAYWLFRKHELLHAETFLSMSLCIYHSSQHRVLLYPSLLRRMVLLYWSKSSSIKNILDITTKPTQLCSTSIKWRIFHHYIVYSL